MKTKTIILFRKQGQLANRLIQFAHVMAFARAHNYRVIHLAFYHYRHYFIQTEKRIFASFPNNGIKLYCPIILNKLFYLFLDRVYKYIINLDNRLVKSIVYKNEEAISLLEDYNIPGLKSRFIAIDGWLIRDFSNLTKYSDEIKAYFKIKPVYKKNIEDFMQPLKDYTCVAVHIRRGDYKIFLYGKYFFSLEVYKKYMFEFSNLINNPKIKFIIFSNEKTEIDFFTPFSAIAGPGNTIEDLYCMAQCDYIMGPPSSFSIWASFYGKKSLYQITDPSKHLSLRDFNICECL